MLFELLKSPTNAHWIINHYETYINVIFIPKNLFHVSDKTNANGIMTIQIEIVLQEIAHY